MEKVKLTIDDILPTFKDQQRLLSKYCHLLNELGETVNELNTNHGFDIEVDIYNKSRPKS